MRIPGSGSYYDAAQHLTMLNMLSVFESSNAGQVFVARFRSQLELGDLVNFTPGVNGCPAFITVQGSTGMVILVDGMRTLGQAGWFIDNTPYNSGFYQSTGGFMNMAWTPALSIASAVSDANLFLADTVWVLGYSWGGSIGKALQYQLGGRMRPTQQNEGWYYGSMRSVHNSFQLGRIHPNFIDVWNIGDAIPSFPTHAFEAPLQIGVLGYFRSNYWDKVRHPCNGVQPQGNQQLIPVLAATLPTATGELRLANWIMGGALIGNPNHSLQSYIDALSPIASSGGGDDAEGSSGGGFDAEPNVMVPQMAQPIPTPTQVRSAINRGVEQQVVYAQGNPQAVLAQVMGAVNRARPDRVHRNVYRGSHVITYQGEVIAVTGSKRQAKQIVREANRQLGFK